MMAGDEERRDRGRAVVGEKLERARKERGLSFEEVGRAIKVHARHLEALERGRFDALPDPAWGRGLLIAYAQYLGLDAGALVEGALVEGAGKRERRSRGRWKRFLTRRRAWVAAGLGAVALTATVAVAMTVDPYGSVSKRGTDIVSGAVPGVLDSGPQRVLVLPVSKDDASVEDAVVVEVAEDGLGLLAIPRSTPAEIPGYGSTDVGSTFASGGPDLTRRAVAGLTGTEVPHHLVVREEGVREIVDSMGGVRIFVPQTADDRSSGVGPQAMTLNGEQAIAYLEGGDRSDDARRAERRRDFLHAMFRQALSPSNTFSDPTTLAAVAEHTETNMNGIEITQLAARVRSLEGTDASVRASTVPSREGVPHP